MEDDWSSERNPNRDEQLATNSKKKMNSLRFLQFVLRQISRKTLLIMKSLINKLSLNF